MKILIRIKIDKQHLKSWYQDIDDKKSEIEINLTKKELIEEIVKNTKLKDVIMSYLN